MASDSERGKETPCRHMGYSFRLTARVILYAPSHRQDSTYHDLCYTSRGALAGTRNSSRVHPMKDRSDDPSHHERTLLPRNYISLLRKPILLQICIKYVVVYTYFRVYIQARCPGHTTQLSGLSMSDSKLVVFVVRC